MSNNTLQVPPEVLNQTVLRRLLVNIAGILTDVQDDISVFKLNLANADVLAQIQNAGSGFIITVEERNKLRSIISRLQTAIETSYDDSLTGFGTNVQVALDAIKVLLDASIPVAATLITTNTVIANTVTKGIYDIDASLGDVTVTLPAFASEKEFTFRKINTAGGNGYVQTAGLDTVNGDTLIKLCGSCYPATTVYSGDTEWGLKR